MLMMVLSYPFVFPVLYLVAEAIAILTLERLLKLGRYELIPSGAGRGYYCE